MFDDKSFESFLQTQQANTRLALREARLCGFFELEPQKQQAMIEAISSSSHSIALGAFLSIIKDIASKDQLYDLFLAAVNLGRGVWPLNEALKKHKDWVAKGIEIPLHLYFRYPQPDKRALLIEKTFELGYVEAMTPNIIERLWGITFPIEMRGLLSLLHASAQAASASNLRALFDYIQDNQALLLSEEGGLNQVWRQIRHEDFSMVHWRKIVAIITSHPQRHQGARESHLAIVQYLKINVLHIYTRAQYLNPPNSTHTASANLATRLSILNLMAIHGKEIDVPEKCLALEQLLKPGAVVHPAEVPTFTRAVKVNANDSYRFDVALRGLRRLLSDNPRLIIAEDDIQNIKHFLVSPAACLVDAQKHRLLAFLSSANGPYCLSMQQFIAYFFSELEHYIAPPTEDISKAEMAKRQAVVRQALVETFYEIERAKNMDDDDDISDADKAACMSGAFNKFPQTLSSFSANIVFLFVNENTIIRKLNQLLAGRIINALTTAGALAQQRLLNKLLSADMAEGLYQEVWRKSQEELAEILHNEYDVFYHLSSELPAINDIIANYEQQILPYLPQASLTHSKPHPLFSISAIKKIKALDKQLGGSTRRFFSTPYNDVEESQPLTESTQMSPQS